MEQAPKPVEAAKPKSKTMWIVAAVIIIIIVIAGVYFAFYYAAAPAYAVSILDDNACAPSAAACKYDPASITVPATQTVRWTNKGNTPHTIHSCTSANNPTTQACPTMNTGAAASVNIASSTLNNAGTFDFKFNSPGTYNYYCDIHRWMTATVVVT